MESKINTDLVCIGNLLSDDRSAIIIIIVLKF